MGGQMAEDEGMILGNYGGKGAPITEFNQGVNIFQALLKAWKFTWEMEFTVIPERQGIIEEPGKRVLRLSREDLGLVLYTGIPKKWLQL